MRFYVASGFCAAVGSMIYTARLETGSPVMGQRILLDVIGAVVIGGTSLTGGRGCVLWTVFGVLLMTLIDNTLNLLGLTNFSVLMAKGTVILVAAILDAARSRHAWA
jgi:ribose/xylose/arabinose/galactoside ABC-type transport system permease subunit